MISTTGWSVNEPIIFSLPLNFNLLLRQMRINFASPLKLRWLSGISKRLMAVSCFVGWLCAGFCGGWSLALKAGISWLFPICNILCHAKYAMLNYCGLSWGIVKGIKISLLVYTWYFIVGFFTFAVEIFLANKLVSWHGKSALIVLDLLSSCPKQVWKALGAKQACGHSDD